MTELRRPLKTTLVAAAALAASAAFAQTPTAPMTPPDATGTVPNMSAGPGPTASSTDPLIQKRIDDQAARDEYKARKADAKGDMKAAKAIRKTEKQEASAKRRAAMAKQGSPVPSPGSSGE